MDIKDLINTVVIYYHCLMILLSGFLSGSETAITAAISKPRIDIQS